MFWLRHKFAILVLAYLMVFFVPIFLSGADVLDSQLVVGLGE